MLAQRVREHGQSRIPFDEGAKGVVRIGGALFFVGLAEAEPLILECMDQLPENEREVLLMKRFENLSWEEIATELGLTQQAVLTRLFRAGGKLREIYRMAAGGEGGT